MPFFLRRGRGRGSAAKVDFDEDKRKVAKRLEEEVSSESDDEEPRKRKNDDTSGSEGEETEMKKKFKQAKLYLRELEDKEREGQELKDVDQQLIANRLQQDHLDESGKKSRKLGELLATPAVQDEVFWTFFGGHRAPVTCFALSSCGTFAVSCAQNGEIVKWEINSKKKLVVLPGISKKVRQMKLENVGHCGAIFAVALSSDDKYLVTGGEDKKIHIYEFDSMKPVKQFSQHRGAVNALCFRFGTQQLFSGSSDRAVKIWDLHEMGYVDTMFGHLDSICCMDALSRERCITAGGRDRSIRIWKIAEESQLVFNAHSGCGSVDCVRLIDEEHFVSGSDDGSLCVWSVFKKKPVCIRRNAHSAWISAVDACKFTDLVVSGSSDGFIRLWICSADYKSLELKHEIPMVGFVNDLRLHKEAKYLFCAVSKEHKWGRWWKISEAKNKLVKIPICFKNIDNVV